MAKEPEVPEAAAAADAVTTAEAKAHRVAAVGLLAGP